MADTGPGVPADSAQEPAGIAALPRFGGLPVPHATKINAQGRPDFTTLDARAVYRCGRQRLCGICGIPITYWCAFAGTLRTAAGGVFLDPPMHVDCARWSLRVCPHIVAGRAVRDSDGRRVGVPDGWVVWITRTYGMGLVAGVVNFTPATPKTLETYRYDEAGRLVSSPRKDTA